MLGSCCNKNAPTQIIPMAPINNTNKTGQNTTGKFIDNKNNKYIISAAVTTIVMIAGFTAGAVTLMITDIPKERYVVRTIGISGLIVASALFNLGVALKAYSTIHNATENNALLP